MRRMRRQNLPCTLKSAASCFMVMHVMPPFLLIQRALHKKKGVRSWISPAQTTRKRERKGKGVKNIHNRMALKTVRQKRRNRNQHNARRQRVDEEQESSFETKALVQSHSPS